ncbi:MAG: PDZ domain-containing protein [Planctomycetota bacterium]
MHTFSQTVSLRLLRCGLLLVAAGRQLAAAPWVQDPPGNAAPAAVPAAAAPQPSSTTSASPATPTTSGTPAASAAPASRDFAALLQDLAAPEFARRQVAISQLRTSVAEPANLQLIEQQIQQSSHPESVRRLIELLETQFQISDYRSVAASSIAELLEQAAISERWYVSEAARAVLSRLWKRRVEVAVTQLQRLRVPLEPGDPTQLWKNDGNARNFPFDPASTQHLRIYIDEHWPEDPRVFVLLRRLTELSVWTRIGSGAVSVYQLQGHPLTAEQTAELKGIFGDLRVEERGRVCLGVVSEQGMNDITGAIIRRVEPGSSADLAGLQPGDLIQSVDGRQVRDFQELVTLLRDYNVGDKVTLRVRSLRVPSDELLNRPPRIFRIPPGIPNPPAPDPEIDPDRPPAPDQKPQAKPGDKADPTAPRDVEVELQGWYDPELLKQPLP